MVIKLFSQPALKNPVMLCSWPGIGNVGVNAIDTLREHLKAHEFGEIEPFGLFDPRKAIIEGGLLQQLEFPYSKFYYSHTPSRDLIFFLGQQQPTEQAGMYAQGQKAYTLASLVLDVAERFGCVIVYTSGAAVTRIHHADPPRVWAVPNTPLLMEQLSKLENTVLMSQVEGREGRGSITGLNGLILGVAQKRRFPAVCLMGEVPYYLQASPWPFPKASKAVLEVLSQILSIQIDLTVLDRMGEKIEHNIDRFLESVYKSEVVGPQVQAEIERLRHARQAKMGPITLGEQKNIMAHIDELFKQEGGGGERHI